ncbi:acylneuraminate cytidylyltransferase family protein, partial [bacterium]|nr:acylneuraminate cytidylyltransferase family protein [bacterium]
MNVICIIPARGGSKGLPNKNISSLDGKPLIAHPVEAAISSGVIDTVFVTTDSDAIARHATEAGAVVPFLRPHELAGDLSTTEETLQYALLEFEKISSRKYDICVFLTATDVFRPKNIVRDVVNHLIDNPTLESVFSGHSTHKNFWEMQNDGSWERVKPWMANYSNRQVRRTIVREDTGIACASRANLWREGRRIGDK